MRRALILLCASNLLASLWGQEVARFDTVRINQMESFAVGKGVYEMEGGYRVFGVQKGLADMSQDIYVTDFDLGGGVIQERTFQTYQQDVLGRASVTVPSPNGYFAGVSRSGVLGILDSLFLYRFNSEGDTLWARFIDVDTTYTMRGIARTVEGDLLITGLHELPREAYVFRLDSLGAIKSYHGYANFEGEDVVVGQEGSWFVGGTGNEGSALFKAYLIRTDSSGTLQWTRILTSQYGSYYSLIALRDGAVVGLGVTAGEGAPDVSLAIKYDTSGTQVWRKDLLPSDDDDRPSAFNAGYEAEDSTLVICGWLSRSDTQTKGTVVKLDKEGEVMWTRLYSHYQVVGVLPWQLFWDVKPTSDGGMVLTGEANSEDYPYAQLWLLKLDSMGCLVPGCGNVGVEEYTDLFNGKLVVAPNPASDNMNLSLHLGEGVSVEGQVRVVVLDATGRRMLEQTVRQNLNQLSATLDVGMLPVGTYYLHLLDAKRWLAGSKVVVEH